MACSAEILFASYNLKNENVSLLHLANPLILWRLKTTGNKLVDGSATCGQKCKIVLVYATLTGAIEHMKSPESSAYKNVKKLPAVFSTSDFY